MIIDVAAIQELRRIADALETQNALLREIDGHLESVQAIVVGLDTLAGEVTRLIP